MKIEIGGEHEKMAMDYQCLELDRINGVLKKYGITDKKLRQDICSEILFHNSYFFDAGWFQRDDKTFYPQLCFAEREDDEDTELGEVKILHVPSLDYELHDYAFGNGSWYFEDRNEDVSEIKTDSS